MAGNALAQTSCLPPPTGLVGWWPGEGNALDLTTNHDDGTAAGSVTYAPGIVGQAFQLDGASYVSVPNNSLLNPAGGITAMAWIKTFYTHDYSSVICKMSGNVGYKLGMAGQAAAGTARCDFGNASGNYTSATNPAPVMDGAWHFLAGTYDNATAILYVDGVAGPLKTAPGYLAGDTQPLLIGYDDCCGGGYYPERHFIGLIDEPAVFNRALSAGEIAGIYAAGSAGMCPLPAITAQPQSATNVFGGTAQFNVSAAGLAPWSYQWRINGVNLSNDTNAALTLTSLVWTDAGNYDVIVSNTYGAVTSQVAALTVNFSAGMPTNGLVSWWRGEGNPDDFVGTNDGVLVGGSFANAIGVIGRGFSFNGSDGFLSVPSFPNLGTNRLTVTLWFRSAISSSGLSLTLFNKGLTFAGSPPYAGCGLRLLDGDLNLCVVDQTGLPSEINLNTPEPSINNWHHAAVTLDRTTSRMGLYLDGVLAAQTDVSALASLDTNIRMAFGALDRTPWGPIAEFFQGQMDEMMYYNRALGAEEVESLYVAQGGQPRLNAQSIADAVLLSWSSACDGYTLESSTDLSVNTWQTVTNAPCLAGCQLQVSVPANAPAQCFFRLHKPGR